MEMGWMSDKQEQQIQERIESIKDWGDKKIRVVMEFGRLYDIQSIDEQEYSYYILEDKIGYRHQIFKWLVKEFEIFNKSAIEVPQTVEEWKARSFFYEKQRDKLQKMLKIAESYLTLGPNKEDSYLARKAEILKVE